MASSSIGIAWRASSRSRTLWRVAVSVSRSAARTRRSNDAAGPFGQLEALQAAGSTIARRASASASIELALACCDKNRRRCRRLGRAHPVDHMAPADEEHRHRQPRRPGRLDDHLQPRPLRRAGQRRCLDRGQALRRRPARAGGPAPPSSRRSPPRCGCWRCPGRSRRSAGSSCPLLPLADETPRRSRPRTATAHGRSESPSRPPHMCSSTGLDLTGRPTSLSGSSVAGSEEASRLPRHDHHVALSVNPPASPRTSRGPPHATPWTGPTGGPEPAYMCGACP